MKQICILFEAEVRKIHMCMHVTIHTYENWGNLNKVGRSYQGQFSGLAIVITVI